MLYAFLYCLSPKPPPPPLPSPWKHGIQASTDLCSCLCCLLLWSCFPADPGVLRQVFLLCLPPVALLQPAQATTSSGSNTSSHEPRVLTTPEAWAVCNNVATNSTSTCFALTEMLEKGHLAEMIIVAGDGAVSQTHCALNSASHS